MIINIHETISNIMTKDKKLIDTTTSETYILYPEQGKVLRNKKTGQIIDSFVGVGSSGSISDYEEVEKEV